MAIKRRSVLAGGAALWVSAPAILRAQSSSKVNVGHGMAMHGQPKYPADADTPDYVNPKAPKGGNAKFGTQGSFDSLHPLRLGIILLVLALTNTTSRPFHQLDKPHLEPSRFQLLYLSLCLMKM